MTAYKFVVMTNPVEGREDEYNDWYTKRHLPDVLDIPGIVAAQRFTATAVQRATEPPPYRYLAVYEIETDDLGQVLEELGRRSGTDKMPMSTAMAEKRMSYVYTPITESVKG